MPALRRLHAGTFPKLWDFSAGAVFPVPAREGARPASVNSVPGFILSYSGGRTYSIKDQQGNIALKDVDFSQAVHIFFSSDSSTFLKRKNRMPLEGDFVLCLPRWLFLPARP